MGRHRRPSSAKLLLPATIGATAAVTVLLTTTAAPPQHVMTPTARTAPLEPLTFALPPLSTASAAMYLAPLPPAPEVVPQPVAQPAAATVTVASTSGGIAARAVSAALGKQGVMYGSMDCSALIQYAYRSAGVSLPRVAADQARMGRSVQVSDLRPGDTLYYNYDGHISHTALFIGGGQIVESSLPGHPIAVRAMYLGKHFVGARRIVG
jgi:cell wall-associated NlpC family hydrolase